MSKTVENASARPSLIRAIVLFLGASFFAYLFGLTVHEFGHYVLCVILGVPERGIVLHPFDLSYNIYGGDLSRAFSTQLRHAISGAAGPMLNMLLGVTVGLVLWRKRSPRLLPILMWASVALLQESVGMIMGLVDYPDVRSDWVAVMLAGVPPMAIGVLAAIVLIAGCIWMLLLLPLAGVKAEDAIWRKLLILLAGIPTLLLGAVIYLNLLGSNSNVPVEWVLQNRYIALASSIILLAVITPLHKCLFPFLERISHTHPAQLTWRDTMPAVGLGTAVIVIQLMFFN